MVNLESKINGTEQLFTTYKNPINTYKFAKILEKTIPSNLNQNFLYLYNYMSIYISMYNESTKSPYLNQELEEIKKRIKDIVLNSKGDYNSDMSLSDGEILEQSINKSFINLDKTTRQLCKRFILEYYKFIINLYNQISDLACKIELNNSTKYELYKDLSFIGLNIELQKDCLSTLIPKSLKEKTNMNSSNNDFMQAIYLINLSNKLYQNSDELTFNDLSYDIDKLAEIKKTDKVNNSVISGFRRQIIELISNKNKQYKKLS